MIRFNVRFSASDQRFSTNVSFDSKDHFDANFEAIHEVTVHKDADPYRGAYVVTPGAEEQVLQTAQKLLTDDVIVKAIPEEYGLVTYDQSRTITVR